MSDFLVDLNGLRTRIREAVSKGVLKENAGGVFETVLIQLVNEAEQNRLSYQNKADQFERQAALFRGQAQAFNSFKVANKNN